MFGDLTRTERYVALVLSIALAFLGLVLVANSRDGLLVVHGWIILAVGLIAVFAAAGYETIWYNRFTPEIAWAYLEAPRSEGGGIFELLEMP